MSHAEVYDNLDFLHYAELPAEHATSLKDAIISPLLYEHRRKHGRPDGDTLRMGRTAHTALLEPTRFRDMYAVWEGARRAGQEWQAFKVEHAGRTVVTRAQLDQALEIAAAVRRHPVASRLLQQGRPEVSIVWTHDRTGLLCKVRLDWLTDDPFVELKTCRDPAPGPFAAQFVRLGYHLQTSMYRSAIIEAGLGERPVKVIAAQNVPPFDVVVYDVPIDALVIGEQAYESALDKVAACRRAKSWPGIAPDAEMELRLPAWAVPQWDDELTMGGEALSFGGDA